MARFNYRKMTKQARKTIRNAGAAFVVEQDGRKRRGYMVMDGVEKGWRDDHLTETETASCLCDIEVNQGDILNFTSLRTRYRVVSCSPEMPDGNVIYWNVDISR